MTTQNRDEQRDVLVLASDTMGRGDDGLGGSLMVSFLSRLAQRSALQGRAPHAIVCYNGGVRLLKIAIRGCPGPPGDHSSTDDGFE